MTRKHHNHEHGEFPANEHVQIALLIILPALDQIYLVSGYSPISESPWVEIRPDWETDRNAIYSLKRVGLGALCVGTYPANLCNLHLDNLI
jgi:hypothetical protein